jgi:hypothetical protein
VRKICGDEEPLDFGAVTKYKKNDPNRFSKARYSINGYSSEYGDEWSEHLDRLNREEEGKTVTSSWKEEDRWIDPDSWGKMDGPYVPVRQASTPLYVIEGDKLIIPNPSLITTTQWERMSQAMKKANYDVRGGEDLKERMIAKGRAVFFDAAAEVVKKVLDGRKPAPSLQPDEAERKRILTRATRHFGVTSNPREAGYLMPNGTMLNFAGMSKGYGRRDFDHRNIGNAFGEKDNGPHAQGGTEGMRAFMSHGPIRILNTNGNTDLDIMTPPTRQQFKKIQELLSQNTETTYIETRKDGNVVNREYPVGTSVGKMLRDINAFYGT